MMVIHITYLNLHSNIILYTKRIVDIYKSEEFQLQWIDRHISLLLTTLLVVFPLCVMHLASAVYRSESDSLLSLSSRMIDAPMLSKLVLLMLLPERLENTAMTMS